MSVAGTMNTTLGKRFQWLDSFKAVPLADRADTRRFASRTVREHEDWGRHWPLTEEEKRDWFDVFTRAEDEAIPSAGDDEWEPLWSMVDGASTEPPRWRAARSCLLATKAKGRGVVTPWVAAAEAQA